METNIKGNILILDDEKSIRITLQRILEKEGFISYTAKTLESAKVIIDEKIIDVIFADICLPEASGLDILNYLKERNLKIPVIMITGQPDLKTATHAVRLGAYDYIIKPLPPFKLIHLANNAVEKKRLDDEWLQIEQLKIDYTHSLEKEVALQTVKIKENERQYKTLVEQSLIGVFIIAQDKIQYANKKFADIFEYTVEELLNNFSIYKLIHPSEMYKLKNEDEYLETLREKSYIYSILKGITKNGNEIILEFWLNRIVYQEKLAIQGIIIDITEKEHLQKKEKELQIKLMNEHKLAMIGQLATGIAHNLNNPLSTLIGYVELLIKKYSNIKELKKIYHQAIRITDIINTLTRKSQRDHNREINPIDINELILDELEFFEADIEYKHKVKRNLKLYPNISQIYGVYSDISQSIQNLIKNAIDSMHNKKQSELTIATTENENFVLIKIIDTGCGIKKENIDNIFQPYFSTKPHSGKEKNREPVGTGLGLASVKQLLAPYDVIYDVKSKVDKGTIFTIKFPKKQDIKKLKENLFSI
jgi:two-component system sporulation sensor kinase A